MSKYEEKVKIINDKIVEIEDKIIELRKEKEKLIEKKNELTDNRNLQKSFQLSSTNWAGTHFEWSQELHAKLKHIFKLEDFRGEQLKVINAFLAKEDVILLAPTGGGKSLCYQLPALITNGFTLVISPLLSLMKDQIWNLKSYGINAEMISASTEKSLVSSLYKAMSDPKSNMRLLYVTPERLAKSKRFMAALQKSHQAGRLDRIAIDEVHCCSQWGHDYRPDYKYLNTLKQLFPDIAILGVTATATTKVILDVQKILNITGCLVLKAPFNRPNLYYHVLTKSANKDEVIDLLEELLKKRYKNQSGIIYTFSIKDAEELATELIHRDIKVRPYHASQDETKRNQIHSNWIDGNIQAVIATVAFGMGINKSNVRFVIHHTMSKSIENYYQESGRAGRDGERAECVLMYRFQDNSRITTMTFSEHMGLRNAYAMIAYCIDGTKCRREIFARYFSENWNALECNNMCDRCLNSNKISPRELNIAPQCLELLKIVERAQIINSKLTGIKLLDAWYHKGANNVQIVDIPKPKLDRHYTEQILSYLILEGYLKEDFVYTAYSTISYIQRGSKLCNSSTTINFIGSRILHLPPAIKQSSSPKIERNGQSSTSTPNSNMNHSHEDKKKSRSFKDNGNDNDNSMVIKSSDDDELEYVPKKKSKISKEEKSERSSSSGSSRKSTSSTLDCLVSKVISAEKKRAKNIILADDDVIIVASPKEVIEID